MGKSIIIASLAGMAWGSLGCAPSAVTTAPTPSCDCGAIVAVKAQDSAGHPMANVRVFDCYRDPAGVNFLAQAATTDKSGGAKLKDPDMLFGIAPDGRSAFSAKGTTLVFGAAKPLLVRLVDEAGRPVANRSVRLDPAEEPAPIRTIGAIGEMQNVGFHPPNLRGTTDATGTVQFLKLPVGVPFAVALDLSKDHFFRFLGTLRPGASWTGIVSRKCVVQGHVYGRHGRPLAGAAVQILHDPYIVGALDSDPDVIASATTDRSGAYRIPNLPNCEFEIGAVPGGLDEAPSERVRSAGGRWKSQNSVEVKPGFSAYDIRVWP